MIMNIERLSEQLGQEAKRLAWLKAENKGGYCEASIATCEAGIARLQLEAAPYMAAARQILAFTTTFPAAKPARVVASKWSKDAKGAKMIRRRDRHEIQLPLNWDRNWAGMVSKGIGRLVLKAEPIRGFWGYVGIDVLEVEYIDNDDAGGVTTRAGFVVRVNVAGNPCYLKRDTAEAAAKAGKALYEAQFEAA